MQGRWNPAIASPVRSLKHLFLEESGDETFLEFIKDYRDHLP